MPLSTLIFFVTSRCNARCQTCFYWKELNQRGDLTFEEIERLSSTMPAFRELWLSGGEPLMRRRLDEILQLFYHQNGVRRLNLPTNGLFPDRLATLMRFVAEELPEMKVNLNLALDGFQETHDHIRGVPGNFDRVFQSLDGLYPVRADFPNIRLHVNSVINTANVDELEDLGWWMTRHSDLDGHYFQVIRGDAKNEDLKRLPSQKLEELYSRIRPLHEHYACKLSRRNGGGLKGWLKKIYYTQAILFHYTVQAKNYEGPSPWPMPCQAGRRILVLDYNGDLRACELRRPLANLRDVDCDFSRLYPSSIFSDETRQIVKDQCWCTHICFIHDSLKASNRVKLYDIPFGRKVGDRPLDFSFPPAGRGEKGGDIVR